MDEIAVGVDELALMVAVEIFVDDLLVEAAQECGFGDFWNLTARVRQKQEFSARLSEVAAVLEGLADVVAAHL